MKILIVTDLSTHNSANSLYKLANALFDHPLIETVVVASRGIQKNESFFKCKSMVHIEGYHINRHISFFDKDELVREISTYKLNSFDNIILRLPYPIDQDFFPALTQNFDETRIINRPSGIALTGDKAFLLKMKTYTPPIQLCHNLEEIFDFSSQYECVLKPRFSYGGKGILRIQKERVWFGDQERSVNDFVEEYKENPQSYLAMKFLKNVSKGDKRLIVVNGEIVSSSLRLPNKGSWLCNISQGGKNFISEPTKGECAMIQKINSLLSEHGIFYYGVDTILDDDGTRKISEINTSSIGGFVAPYKEDQPSPESKFANHFVNYYNESNVENTHR